ncbi:hypothetical protein K438DRAFT_1960374 [Mycena galopus ATCC 62051]|nr:hypothetical protein K438DRAFT_1960374 [Mycena galopus ATCC 62051]
MVHPPLFHRRRRTRSFSLAAPSYSRLSSPDTVHSPKPTNPHYLRRLRLTDSIAPGAPGPRLARLALKSTHNKDLTLRYKVHLRQTRAALLHPSISNLEPANIQHLHPAGLATLMSLTHTPRHPCSDASHPTLAAPRPPRALFTAAQTYQRTVGT